MSENCTFSARNAALLRCLPADFRADLDALDLAAHDLSRVRAGFILVHGIADDMLPHGGSVGLAAALASAQARLFLLRGFERVDMVPGSRTGGGCRAQSARSLTTRQGPTKGVKETRG